ncbi:MAG: phosphoribosylformylglycinamidine cyclo-ligase [Alphaproteobacteria bacterium]|nr:phosphoribosylformylglycinamidine cyclo-ligase [Alphaproteobacteria bacterium]
MTYKNSGVDVTKANMFVRAIQADVKNTLHSAVLQRTGAFGSLFDISKEKLKEPVLVSSTDGVGTKLLIAQMMDVHYTVGIDLVAMNVNDILCVGAKPLFFLDYIACGKLEPKVLKKVVSGIAKGCKEAGCALIGGETAEMPDMYKKDEYDLAGFALGIVEKSKIIDGSKIAVGDQVIGFPSNGLHSNGFSLVRKVFTPMQQKVLSRELLRPTRIYVKEILPLIQKFHIKGIAHITGGAFYEKLTKILPKSKCFSIDKKSWPVPKIFRMIQKEGKVSEKEMYRTFNMGIGMAIVVSKQEVLSIKKYLKQKNIEHFNIGHTIHCRSKKIDFTI